MGQKFNSSVLPYERFVSAVGLDIICCNQYRKKRISHICGDIFRDNMEPMISVISENLCFLEPKKIEEIQETHL